MMLIMTKKLKNGTENDITKKSNIFKMLVIWERCGKKKKKTNNNMKDRMTWAHLLAVVLFSTPLLFLYSNKFKLDDFCILNNNEPICKINWDKMKDKIDCLTIASGNNPAITAYMDDVAGYITLGHGFTSSITPLVIQIFDFLNCS